MSTSIDDSVAARGHPRWVRLTHWLIAAAVLTLAFSGYAILMVHPRLYWGDAGNSLTPALIELPISRNHRNGNWSEPVPFFTAAATSPVTSNRDFPDMFNQNAWARSLHFLAAWCAVLGGLVYVIVGLLSGHARRDLWPRAREVAPQRLWRDVCDHLRLKRIRSAGGGPPYGPLQKLAYSFVVFVALPTMVLTGLAMSPAVTAAIPPLASLFGGSQSSRTVHFFVFAAVVTFVIVHVVMVLLSGFGRQMRGMTIGSRR
jgi:thiosulfate reductase cytochrome b subunit